MTKIYRIGCSGYYYRGWQDIWYPDQMKTHRWFGYYAEHFDTVEINASFYRFPTQSGVRRWYRQAPKDFTYSVKAPRLITHMKRFSGTERLLADFYGVLANELKEKLGCVLFQMPPSMHYKPESLERILKQMQPGFCNVLEFRHASWWCEDVYAQFRKAGVIFCSVHAPGLPDDIISTARDIYVRLHGDPWCQQNYSEAELSGWAGRIRSARAKRVWVYFNNDSQAFAPSNALHLRKLLNE